MDAIVRYPGGMAARDRQTASYASLPYATLTDKAAMATRQRTVTLADERAVRAEFTATIDADPEQWQCARATDLVGESARIRSARADRNDPE